MSGSVTAWQLGFCMGEFCTVILKQHISSVQPDNSFERGWPLPFQSVLCFGINPSTARQRWIWTLSVLSLKSYQKLHMYTPQLVCTNNVLIVGSDISPLPFWQLGKLSKKIKTYFLGRDREAIHLTQAYFNLHFPELKSALFQCQDTALQKSA